MVFYILDLLMVFHCQPINNALKDCLSKWYTDDEFKDYCKELYLKKRSAYRATGIKIKAKDSLVK